MFTNNQKNNEWELMKKDSPLKYYIYLLFVSIILFISNISLLVFFKKITDIMLRFSYLIYLLTSLVFVIVFFILKYIKIIVYKIYSKFIENIEIKTIGLPHSQYFLLGMLDSIKYILLFLSAHRVSPNLQSIMSNIHIVITFITFVVSYIFMKNKFKLIYFMFDFLVSFIIFIGIIISLIPVFIDIAANPLISDTGMWSIMFSASFIPSSIMFILQEIFSKYINDIDYFELNLWIGIYQALFCLFYFWVNFIFPSINIHNLKDLGDNFVNGFSCIIGQNITFNSEQLDCQFAALYIIIYICSYIGTYLFNALLLRMTSYLFVSFLNVFVSHITIIFFYVIDMDEFNVYIAFSIPIIIVGIIINIIVDYKRTKSIYDDCINKENINIDETTKLI